MFKVRVVKITKERLVETGEPFLDVAVELVDFIEEDGGEVVKDQRKFGFPIDITEKALQNELRKYADLYEAELKSSAAQGKQDVQDKQADSLIKAMQGKVL